MKTRTALSLAFFALAVLTLGGLFKFLHWPGANAQVLLGASALAVALVGLGLNVARHKLLKGLGD